MGDALNTANSLIASIGSYTRLVILGVWFPGFLLFCEISYLLYRLALDKERTYFTFVVQGVTSLDSPVILTAGVVLVLAISIALGYVGRDVAFAISDYWLARGRPPVRKVESILEQIEQVYGRERVGNILKRYPVFNLASDEKAVESLPRLPESYIREFCKLWLRARKSELSTEGLEIEINMVIGLVGPVAVAGIILPLLFGAPTVGGVVLSLILVLASFSAAGLMMYRINWARNLETEQVIVYFLFSHWEELHRIEASMDP